MTSRLLFSIWFIDVEKKAAITHNKTIEIIAITARKTIIVVIVTIPLKRFSAVCPIQ